MTGQFGLHDGGLHPLSRIHGEVADGLGELTGTDAADSDVAQSFGHIASSMHRALGGTMDSRGSTFDATRRSSTVLAGQLQRAHDAYVASDEDGAHDIATAAGVHADAGGTGLPRVLDANQHGGNGFDDVRGAAVESVGYGTGSSGTPAHGSAGTPADTEPSGPQPSDAIPPGAAGPVSAMPSSAHDVAGGTGNAASIGQPLSQVLGPAGQHVGSLGPTEDGGFEGTAEPLDHAGQRITQVSARFDETGGGEHGPIGASAHVVGALGLRMEAPAGSGDGTGLEPADDDADPQGDDLGDEPRDDDRPPDDRPPRSSPPLAAVVSPLPSGPARQRSGRTDDRRV